jgi:hypothetical protein
MKICRICLIAIILTLTFILPPSASNAGLSHIPKLTKESYTYLMSLKDKQKVGVVLFCTGDIGSYAKELKEHMRLRIKSVDGNKITAKASV